MNLHRAIAISLVSLLLVTPSLIQAQSNDQLGKVDFQNSCSPALQESFQRAVAMLHPSATRRPRRPFARYSHRIHPAPSRRGASRPS